MVKHLPHHPQVKDLSQDASTGTGRDGNCKKCRRKNQNGWSVVGSIVVEHLPHHPKVENSSLATAACTGRGNGKMLKEKILNVLSLGVTEW